MTTGASGLKFHPASETNAAPALHPDVLGLARDLNRLSCGPELARRFVGLIHAEPTFREELQPRLSLCGQPRPAHSSPGR